ncbi:MAG TPA: hypothetical protein VNJ52_11165 [Patescibacteria group bacterium]|nr:hypothetical protein [Patescibacteria group bacterium]
MNDFPLGFVTTTSTKPAACAGVSAVIWVELVTLTDVPAAPPKVTAAPDCKLLPLMVTAVPPAVLPLDGEIAEIAGPGPEALKCKPEEEECLFESCTWAVNIKLPVCVGVPAICPSVDKLTPAGNDPLTTAQEYGAVPPVACKVAE